MLQKTPVTYKVSVPEWALFANFAFCACGQTAFGIHHQACGQREEIAPGSAQASLSPIPASPFPASRDDGQDVQVSRSTRMCESHPNHIPAGKKKRG